MLLLFRMNIRNPLRQFHPPGSHTILTGEERRRAENDEILALLNGTHPSFDEVAGSPASPSADTGETTGKDFLTASEKAQLREIIQMYNRIVDEDKLEMEGELDEVRKRKGSENEDVVMGGAEEGRNGDWIGELGGGSVNGSGGGAGGLMDGGAAAAAAAGNSRARKASGMPPTMRTPTVGSGSSYEATRDPRLRQ